jgi:peptide/nickel transport system permease protein
MLVFTINRIIQSIIVIFLTSIVIFAGIFAIGNPVDLLMDSRATFEEMEQIKANLGLDKPFWEQYYIFLKSAVKGDFGHSYIYNVPAMQLIFQRLPATLELAFISLILSIFIGIPVGVVAGIYSKNIFSKCVMFISVLGFSLPSFWVGLMLIMVFSVNFGWLPSFGRGETISLFGI